MPSLSAHFNECFGHRIWCGDINTGTLTFGKDFDGQNIEFLLKYWFKIKFLYSLKVTTQVFIFQIYNSHELNL
jgi:hypothetical protein